MGWGECYRGARSSRDGRCTAGWNCDVFERKLPLARLEGPNVAELLLLEEKQNVLGGGYPTCSSASGPPARLRPECSRDSSLERAERSRRRISAVFEHKPPAVAATRHEHNRKFFSSKRSRTIPADIRCVRAQAARWRGYTARTHQKSFSSKRKQNTPAGKRCAASAASEILLSEGEAETSLLRRATPAVDIRCVRAQAAPRGLRTARTQRKFFSLKRSRASGGHGSTVGQISDVFERERNDRWRGGMARTHRNFLSW